MHTRITHVYNTFLKGLALFAGTIFALYAAYLLAWRAWACSEITRLNAMAPPTDINSYLMRRIAQREVCGVGDQIFSIFIFFLGITLVTYAWHTLRTPSKAVPG